MIPKNFIPKKDSKKGIKRLLEKTEYNPRTLQILLESCEEFLKAQEDEEYIGGIYKVGERLASELSYDKHEIEELSKLITVRNKKDSYLGYYLSALINKIITEKDVITLEINAELHGIGTYLQKGTLIIKGNTGDDTGFCMKEHATIKIYGKINHISGCCKGKIYEEDKLVWPE